MKYPHRWMIRRPGLLIPVFFLLCFQARAQLPVTDAETAALGQCSAGRSGKSGAGLNPAGLGGIKESSCSILHYRPFLQSGLDIVSLALQVSTNRGAPGILFSSMGIAGMRQSSGWISYGLELHPMLFAGAGIHLGITSVAEYHLHRIDAGFALGIQIRISDRLILGAHLRQLKLLSGNQEEDKLKRLNIVSGFSYSVFETVWYHSEFQAITGKHFIWRQGLSIGISRALKLFLGMHNQPWTFSTGISLDHRNWLISLAAIFCMDRGISPASSLSYAW